MCVGLRGRKDSNSISEERMEEVHSILWIAGFSVCHNQRRKKRCRWALPLVGEGSQC